MSFCFTLNFTGFLFNSEGNCVYSNNSYNLFYWRYNSLYPSSDNYFELNGENIVINIDDCSYISIITGKISYAKCDTFCSNEKFVRINYYYYDDYPKNITNNAFEYSYLFNISNDNRK